MSVRYSATKTDTERPSSVINERVRCPVITAQRPTSVSHTTVGQWAIAETKSTR